MPARLLVLELVRSKYKHTRINTQALWKYLCWPLQPQFGSCFSLYTALMAGTQSVRAPSVDDEPGDISAPQSPSSIASVRSSSVFSAAKKLVQVRENLTEFHKKGGIVGWLHGDESEVRTASAVDQAADVSDELGDTLVLAYSPKRSSREALNLQLWQSSPLSASATETAVAEDDGLYTPPSPRSVSTSPAKLCTPPSTPLAAQVSGRSSYSSSVIESLYEKVLKASTSSSSPRHSLQPSPRRKSGRVDALVSGFDDFVGTDGSSRSRVSTILIDSCVLKTANFWMCGCIVLSRPHGERSQHSTTLSVRFCTA